MIVLARGKLKYRKALGHKQQKIIIFLSDPNYLSNKKTIQLATSNEHTKLV